MVISFTPTVLSILDGGPFEKGERVTTLSPPLDVTDDYKPLHLGMGTLTHIVTRSGSAHRNSGRSATGVLREH
jgi:hypothetical protein